MFVKEVFLEEEVWGYQGVGGEVWGACVCLVEAERAESRRRGLRGAPGA